MFKHILVPLDGSKLAEAAVPVAASLAQTLNAPVTLLHIIEQDAPQEIHKDHHITQAEEASAYLKEIAKRGFPAQAQVDTHVHTAAVKDVPGSIVEHALMEFQPDLIIMCTHGSGGVRDLLYGSIAQQVVAQGSTPLLLIKPEAETPTTFKLENILIPLDTGPVHDASLPITQEFARAYKSNIHLLTVIPTFSTIAGETAAAGSLLPATTSALLDIDVENAQEDLQEHLDELKQSGLRVTAEVARGDPATEIVNIAGKLRADMIVLTTHRKAGAAAFWARSVAPNVVRRAHIPILLIPLEEKKAVSGSD
ncbi:MAG TPA: universal stress protein [Anaerolineales bacterium]|nr:universal stress protein [Anaerolineales bacterium]